MAGHGEKEMACHSEKEMTYHSEKEMAYHSEKEMAYHSEKEMACSVRGYHIYTKKKLWAAVICLLYVHMYSF